MKRDLKQKNKLYFLKLNIKNHPLFEKNLEFSLVNDSRVTDNTSNRLTHLIGSVWVNNLITLVGKNATGKTTIMRFLIGTLEVLLTQLSIEQTPLKEVLIGNKPIEITSYFYGNDKFVYKDVLTFLFNSEVQKWHIKNEKIYCKKATKNISKKQIFNFDNVEPDYDREDLRGIAASILSPDDSIFRIIIRDKKYYTQFPIDDLFYTNINALFYQTENVPTEILNFLDPTIEYLKIENRLNDHDNAQVLYRLKFKNRKTEITENDFDTIEKYLSSGTAKGITLYGDVITALKTGGIIFIDELENHFNHAIVNTFIEYFTDSKININRATLIFSTHYSELLDQIERNDEVYIAKRDGKIRLERYSKAGIRNDLHKSEVFDSDYLGGTAPNYTAYMAVKRATKKAVQTNDK